MIINICFELVCKRLTVEIGGILEGGVIPIKVLEPSIDMRIVMSDFIDTSA